MKESVIGRYLENQKEYKKEAFKRMIENEELAKQFEKLGIDVKKAKKDKDFIQNFEIDDLASFSLDIRDDLDLTKDIFGIAIEDFKKELDMVQEFAVRSSFLNIEELSVIMVQILETLKHLFEHIFTLICAREDKDDVMMFGDIDKAYTNFIGHTNNDSIFESLNLDEDRFDNTIDIAFKVVEGKMEQDGIKGEMKEEMLKHLHQQMDQLKEMLFDEDKENEQR